MTSTKAASTNMPGEHAGHVEHALGLLDQVTKPGRRAEIFADHGTDDGKADRGMKRRKHPRERRRPIHVTHQRPLAHAEHAGIGEHGRAHLLHALIHVEEHDEEDEGDAERDLRPDAKSQPEREDRCQHHARQRVDHLHVRIEHRSHARLLREPEAGQDAGNRADDEGEHGLDQRDPQMLPDRALDEPFDDAGGDVGRRREEERRQQLDAADRHGGEHLPEQHRDDGDEKLEREKGETGHAGSPLSGVHGRARPGHPSSCENDGPPGQARG